jgi:ABC-type glycerol-3-phosphate transport system substrate-binding protein
MEFPLSGGTTAGFQRGAVARGGRPTVALTRGWVWAVSETDPRVQEVSIRLAQFLTEDDFLAQWTEENGFLPTRPSALDAWENQSLRTLVEPVVLSAQAPIRPPI